MCHFLVDHQNNVLSRRDVQSPCRDRRKLSTYCMSNKLNVCAGAWAPPASTRIWRSLAMRQLCFGWTNTLFRQLLTRCAPACANFKFCFRVCQHQLVRRTQSHLLCVLDQCNSHTTAASLTQPDSNISDVSTHVPDAHWTASLIMIWCLISRRENQKLFCWGLSHTWPLSSAHLDTECCCTVTCWGVVSFHASPPPDGQQVPHRPLDSVCMRRAKCPPAAWQAAQGPVSATSTNAWKEMLIMFYQLRLKLLFK